MNYQEIFNKALSDIKSKWELPPTGFLAGGSISNVVWNILYDKSSPINDLDVYHLIEIKKNFKNEDLRNKQHFIKNEKWVYEDYTGLNIGYQQRGYYTIEKVTDDGIFNNIEYKSTTSDRMLVLESFDINCCQLGYDIDKDEFIWTRDFEKFLETGELRLCNLTSPPHSALRLVKKKYDLDAHLPQLELDIISTVMKDVRFVDSQKFRFKERYAKMFKKYEYDLKHLFKLERDLELESWLQISKNITDKIWTLLPKGKPIEIDYVQTTGILLSKDFLYYVRNILNNKNHEKIWSKLHPIIDTTMEFDIYFDNTIEESKLDTLHRLVNKAPNCASNFKGMTLSEQINTLENVLEKFPKDPFIAVSILENYDLRRHNIDDDMELLLMELSIRKTVSEDTNDKVYHIFGIETWHNQVGK